MEVEMSKVPVSNVVLPATTFAVRNGNTGTPSVIIEKRVKQFNLFTKVLFAATGINFVLLIVIVICLTTFETRHQHEIDSLKEDTKELKNQNFPSANAAIARQQGASGSPGLPGMFSQLFLYRYLCMERNRP